MATKTRPRRAARRAIRDAKLYRLAATAARARFADLINQVAYHQDRVVLHRHGKNVAALISVEDLKLLQALEDRFDVEAVPESLAEPGQNVPWEQVKAELGV